MSNVDQLKYFDENLSKWEEQLSKLDSLFDSQAAKITNVDERLFEYATQIKAIEHQEHDLINEVVKLEQAQQNLSSILDDLDNKFRERFNSVCDAHLSNPLASQAHSLLDSSEKLERAVSDLSNVVNQKGEEYEISELSAIFKVVSDYESTLDSALQKLNLLKSGKLSSKPSLQE